MRKNLDNRSNVSIAPLDWFDFLNPPSSHSAQLRKKQILDHLRSGVVSGTAQDEELGQSPDVIICCDCIYNPGLFDALIAALNVFTEKQKTVVLVSCEMRSDESLAEFLTKWKASDDDWRIVSLEERFDKGFVALAAWKA